MKVIPKWKILGKVNKVEIPFADIDENIHTIIRLFNEIPWLATWSSCEGHPYKTVSDWHAVGGINLQIYDEEKWKILIALFDLECQEDDENFNIGIEKGFRYNPKDNCLISTWGISWSAQGLTKEDCERRLRSTWCKLEFYLRKYRELNDRVGWECHLSWRVKNWIEKIMNKRIRREKG